MFLFHLTSYAGCSNLISNVSYSYYTKPVGYSIILPPRQLFLSYSFLISNDVFFYLNLPVGCSYLNLSVSCSYIILPVSSSCFILPAGCMVHAVDAIPSSRIASKSIAIALEDKILVVTYTRAR